MLLFVFRSLWCISRASIRLFLPVLSDFVPRRLMIPSRSFLVSSLILALLLLLPTIDYLDEPVFRLPPSISRLRVPRVDSSARVARRLQYPTLAGRTRRASVPGQRRVDPYSVDGTAARRRSTRPAPVGSDHHRPGLTPGYVVLIDRRNRDSICTPRVSAGPGVHLHGCPAGGESPCDPSCGPPLTGTRPPRVSAGPTTSSTDAESVHRTPGVMPEASPRANLRH